MSSGVVRIFNYLLGIFPATNIKTPPLFQCQLLPICLVRYGINIEISNNQSVIFKLTFSNANLGSQYLLKVLSISSVVVRSFNSLLGIFPATNIKTPLSFQCQLFPICLVRYGINIEISNNQSVTFKLTFSKTNLGSQEFLS